jgi:hypothetical protein
VDLREVEPARPTLSEIRAASPQIMLESTIVRGEFQELRANPDIEIVALL